MARHRASTNLAAAVLPVALAVAAPQAALLARAPGAHAAGTAVAAGPPALRPAAAPVGWVDLASPACVLRGPRAGRYARVCSHLLTRGLGDLKSYCAMRGLHANRITTASDVRVRVEACNLWVNHRAVRAAPETVGQGFTDTQTPGAWYSSCPGRWETHMEYSIRWPDNSLSTGRILAPVTAC